MRFTLRQHLHAALFDRPCVVDDWLDALERQLVLDVWRQGWLPRDIEWDMWVERMASPFDAEATPVVEACIQVTERRS